MTSAPFHASNLLLYAPNWLGDAVMALPSLLAWREANPEAEVTLLTRPGLVPLWGLCPAAADEVVALEAGTPGTCRAARAARARRHDASLSMPNSFRSALLPWLARIPRRRGSAMHARSLLLTDRIPCSALAGGHQACANFVLFGLPRPDSPAKLPSPLLRMPEEETASARIRAGAKDGAPLLALIPGAARGSSKRWPAAHFVSAALLVAGRIPGLRFVVCGAKNEADACGEVAAGLPAGRTVNLAGKTDLRGLAAVLAACGGVCCNDSGGMHLAAAVGTPLAAVFGLTDAVRTGPLGPTSRVVQRNDVRHDSAIARRSAEASAVLASIAPERVASALLEVIRP